MKYAEEKKKLCMQNDTVLPELYSKYNVKRGLRDVNGKGVLTGLTNISKIESFDENAQPCDGKLWYRGYRVEKLINEHIAPDEYGFEKIAYLLLFGELPTQNELADFKEVIAHCRKLPRNFTKDVIMKAPGRDIMNSMTKSILTLASYDKDIENNSLETSIVQCIRLIALFPLLAVYGYHAYNHYKNEKSMYIHLPRPELSGAENLLTMLRPDCKYTPFEAKVLDTALILHMEHGGGNNSTFTTRVVTSAGSDTYSTIAAAMSSLKGPRHGGANIKVAEMIRDIKRNVNDITDENEVRAYLTGILNKENFDKKGLIYGMGHAIYSVSDPRERVFKKYVEELAVRKNRKKDMRLYNIIEQSAPDIIAEKRKIYKGVSPNVDFYSGFVYDMLNIPTELFTPIFAIARIVGWSAHRIEEIICDEKIIRPAYMSVMEEKEI